jgi:hypothetical protein
VKRFSKLGSDHGFLVCRSFGGGVSRLRRALLSFASPKESKQRKGDPGRRPATRGSLRYSVGAGAAELGPAGLRQSSPFFRPNLRCSAPHKGPGILRGTTCSTRFLTLYKDPGLGAGWFAPSRRQRRATEALADKGRGLFEGRSPEFRSALSDAQHREEVLPGCPRQRRVAQGTRVAGADAGSPSFCLLFLGEARKSKARRQRETPRSHERQTPKPCSVPGLSAVWR